MGRSGGYRWLKSATRVAVGLLVLGAVARHVGKTWADLRARGGPPPLEAAPFALAVLLYLAGLSLFGLYFVRVMAASATPVGALPGWRAYLISHLGKYVPGKALVVVMRVGLVTPYGARASTAAFATIYETLVMMAVGGGVAFVGFGLTGGRPAPVTIPLGRWGPLPIPLGLLGLGLGLAFALVVLPAVFPRISALARQPFPDVGPEALPRFSGRLLAEGLALSVAGWVLLGLSQVAVIRALSPSGLPASAWPAAVASVALATVAGFVVPVAPGGLGVREWVLWTSLGSVLDRETAVLASLGLRLAWIAGEVLAAAALVPTGRAPRPRAIEAVAP